MNWFDNYRQQNQHLFGEDSDFSDTEEDFEPEENEEIEIEESQETEDYEALKSSLNFKPVHNEEPQRGRPASTSNSRTQILEISENKSFPVQYVLCACTCIFMLSSRLQ